MTPKLFCINYATLLTSKGIVWFLDSLNLVLKVVTLL